jgi:hypothetical protein
VIEFQTRLNTIKRLSRNNRRPYGFDHLGFAVDERFPLADVSMVCEECVEGAYCEGLSALFDSVFVRKMLLEDSFFTEGYGRFST